MYLFRQKKIGAYGIGQEQKHTLLPDDLHFLGSAGDSQIILPVRPPVHERGEHTVSLGNSNQFPEAGRRVANAGKKSGPAGADSLRL